MREPDGKTAPEVVSETETSSEPVRQVLRVVLSGCTWKVVPGVKKIHAGDEVVFESRKPLWIFFMDEQLFGRGRLYVDSGGHDRLVVTADETGLYPYAVLVDTEEGWEEGYVLAEGSTLPVFLVAY